MLFRSYRLPPSIPHVQAAFAHITHFNYASRIMVSNENLMPYAELCLLLVYFVNLQVLVLDGIDLSSIGIGPMPALPLLPHLRKLVIHRCEDIIRLTNDLAAQAVLGRLPHVRHLEVGKIAPESLDSAHRLVAALLPQLTALGLGYDYEYDVDDCALRPARACAPLTHPQT